MAFVPGSLGAGAFNRALDQSPWAREKLAPHEGRRFTVEVGPMHAAFLITPDGRVEQSSPSGAVAPDLRVRVSPLTLPAFLADPQRWNEFVTEEGDVALGGTLKELAHALPWLVEAAFARTFGDVAGLRIANAGRRLLEAPGYAASRLADSLASYGRDEARLLARGADMRSLVQQAQALESRAVDAEARLDALAARLATGPAGAAMQRADNASQGRLAH